jgi:hypothetical protein
MVSSVGSLAACSRSKGGSGTEKAGSKPAPSGRSAVEGDAVALCSALHELPSRRRAECCAEPPLSVYYDECVRLLSNAVRARTVSIDGERVASCARRVTEATQGCDWVAPTLGAAPAECDGAVRGLVGEGGSCKSSLECKGALHCAGQGATTPGVCRAPQAVGSACGTSVDSLATYLSVRSLEAKKPVCGEFCDLKAHRCEARPREGAPCSASVNCANDQTCRKGRCETRAAVAHERRALSGEACASDLDCEAGGCVANPAGERRCAKKCSSDLGSLAGRPALGPLVLGRQTSSRPSARTSTRSESTNR